MYRKDYINWDEYFMGIALLSCERSKDPNTQVGACIVSKDNRILSVGYNGTPNGIEDKDFSWKREGEFLDTKYAYVVHGEANAIANYRGNKKDFEDSKIYVTLFPCNECSKMIVQNGIKEVIYLNDKYDGTDENVASKRILDSCNVIYRKFDTDKENIVLKLK